MRVKATETNGNDRGAAATCWCDAMSMRHGRAAKQYGASSEQPPPPSTPPPVHQQQQQQATGGIYTKPPPPVLLTSNNTYNGRGAAVRDHYHQQQQQFYGVPPQQPNVGTLPRPPSSAHHRHHSLPRYKTQINRKVFKVFWLGDSQKCCASVGCYHNDVITRERISKEIALIFLLF